VREKGSGGADVLDTDETMRRRLRLRFFEQRVEFRNSGRGARGQRSRRNRMHAYTFWTKLGGKVPHGALQRGIGAAHDIIRLPHPLAAVIGHGEQSSAVAHKRFRQMRHADEGPARNFHRRQKALPRHIDDTSLKGFLRRKRDRMDDKIQLSPRFRDGLEQRLHLARDARVERHDDLSFKFPRQRLDVFLGFVVEVSHSNVGAERAERLGAPPCNRLIVGDADDQAPFSFQQLGFYSGNHGLYPSPPAR
jgi:hypothetical protein